jgi:predicted MFS family arabinose efflux permease
MAARLLLAFSAMPAAKVCRLTGSSPAVWPRLSMITGGLTLAIVAGVAVGVLVNGRFGWHATFLGVVGAGGALAARHPRLAAAPAACRPPKG